MRRLRFQVPHISICFCELLNLSPWGATRRVQTGAIAKGTFVPARRTIGGPLHRLAPITSGEGRMSKLAIRLLTLASYATTLGVFPIVAPTVAETSNGRHIKKHKQKSSGFSDPWSAGRAWPVTRPSSQAGGACPGMARGIDCSTWPPPMDEDPDRKASSSDGG
jgi:hypothetical protein